MFRVSQSSKFERDFDRLARAHRVSTALLDELKPIFQSDPYNRSRAYHIKKLHDIKQGEGEWCLRIGIWRVRYDISGASVILHSLKPRPEAYRK